jgi:hypothetical protein
MHVVAIGVFVGMLAVSLWAWRAAPGQQAADQFIGIWRAGVWGKQFYCDFFSLEVVLALWMLPDGAARGHWLLAPLCVITMPVFGALPAALYWVLR